MNTSTILGAMMSGALLAPSQAYAGEQGMEVRGYSQAVELAQAAQKKAPVAMPRFRAAKIFESCVDFPVVEEINDALTSPNLEEKITEYKVLAEKDGRYGIHLANCQYALGDAIHFELEVMAINKKQPIGFVRNTLKKAENSYRNALSEYGKMSLTFEEDTKMKIGMSYKLGSLYADWAKHEKSENRTNSKRLATDPLIQFIASMKLAAPHDSGQREKAGDAIRDLRASFRMN